ncbi:MAG: hypothetical protein Q8Q12_05120, partial [bacterium]|nr:hypothetical protein [bacterium]
GVRTCVYRWHLVPLYRRRLACILIIDVLRAQASGSGHVLLTGRRLEDSPAQPGRRYVYQLYPSNTATRPLADSLTKQQKSCMILSKRCISTHLQRQERNMLPRTFRSQSPPIFDQHPLFSQAAMARKREFSLPPGPFLIFLNRNLSRSP